MDIKDLVNHDSWTIVVHERVKFRRDGEKAMKHRQDKPNDRWLGVECSRRNYQNHRRGVTAETGGFMNKNTGADDEGREWHREDLYWLKRGVRQMRRYRDRAG